MGNVENRSLIPKSPLGNQISILDSQIDVGPTKMNLIPLLILPSKYEFHSDSRFLFLNLTTKHSVKVFQLYPKGCMG